MKPVYEMSLEELQELDGSISDTEPGRETAMYWLIGAIIDLHINRCPAQTIAYAMKEIGLTTDDLYPYLQQEDSNK